MTSNHSTAPPTVEKAHSFAAFITFFKSLLGAGVLALPNIFGDVGLIVGCISYLVVTAGCTFSCYLLLAARDVAVAAEQKIHATSSSPSSRRRPCRIVTYGDLAGALFNDVMAGVTKWTIIVLNFLFTAGLVIVICENMSIVTNVSHRVVGMALLPVVMTLVQLPWLQDMFFISFLGIVVYGVGVMGSTFYSAHLSLAAAAATGSGGGGDGPIPHELPNDVLAAHWDRLPTFIGSAVYALEGINLALPTVHSMEDPHHGIAVVCSSLGLYGVVTLVFGAVGYIGGLGGHDCDIVTVCIHPPVLKVVVQVALSVAMVLTLPVMLYPSTEMLEVMLTDLKRAGESVDDDNNNEDADDISLSKMANDDEKKRSTRPAAPNVNSPLLPRHDTTWRTKQRPVVAKPRNGQQQQLQQQHEKSTSLRLVLAFLTVMMGAFTPSFTLFSALVGAVGLTFAGFILPPCVYVAAMRQSGNDIGRGMWFCLGCLVMFGLWNMSVGGYGSAVRLWDAMI